MTVELTALRVPCGPERLEGEGLVWGTVGLSPPQYGAHETQLQALDKRSK